MKPCETRHFISNKDTLVSYITAPSVGKHRKLKQGFLFKCCPVQQYLYFSIKQFTFTHTHTHTHTNTCTHIDTSLIHTLKYIHITTRRMEAQSCNKTLFGTPKFMSCLKYGTRSHPAVVLRSVCSDSQTQNRGLQSGQAEQCSEGLHCHA